MNYADYLQPNTKVMVHSLGPNTPGRFRAFVSGVSATYPGGCIYILTMVDKLVSIETYGIGEYPYECVTMPSACVTPEKWRWQDLGPNDSIEDWMGSSSPSQGMIGPGYSRDEYQRRADGMKNERVDHPADFFSDFRNMEIPPNNVDDDGPFIGNRRMD